MKAFLCVALLALSAVNAADKDKTDSQKPKRHIVEWGGIPTSYTGFESIGTGIYGSINLSPQLTSHTHSYRHRTETVPVGVPQAVPVTITKHVGVPQPYTVEVPKPYAVPVHVKVPYDVPKPYTVKVPQPVAVKVPVHVPYEVPKPYTVEVTKTVPVEVPKTVVVKVPHAVPVHVPQAVPVEVPTAVHYKVRTPVYVKEPQYVHTYSTNNYANYGNYDLYGITDYGLLKSYVPSYWGGYNQKVY